MNVIFKQERQIAKFKDIYVNTIFLYNNNVYLKVEKLQHGVYTVNAISLSSEYFKHLNFNINEEVERIDRHELIIY